MGSVDAFHVERRIGLGIAEPSSWASFEHVLEGAALSRISVRMKLPVPLMMPASQLMRLPARPSRIALITGIPPATEASNATMTPSRALAKISLPCTAISAPVRSDHMLAILDGLEHQFLGYRVAADQLDNDVDFRVVHDIEDVGGDRVEPVSHLELG